MSKEVRQLLMMIGERTIKGVVPPCEMEYDHETHQLIVSLDGCDRKLVKDPDGAINWYNANGPEA